MGVARSWWGPVDGTGQIAGKPGRNVLWAYVCGDYDEQSPGNRVMQGHTAPVVSAAWAQEGSTAVTGDAAGRVIEWNATTMKESRRRELGGRIAAVAISNDGRRIAAYVLGKHGHVFVWNTGDPKNELRPIHTDFRDYGGPHLFASLDFSPDGNRLAGCAGNQNWLSDTETLSGKVRVWTYAAAPAQQPAPKLAYVKPIHKANGSEFVVPNNNVILATASGEGAVILFDVDDGKILSRIVLSESRLRETCFV